MAKTSAPPVLKNTLSTVLGIMSGTLLGTGALVSIHHYYRKSSNPNARWQDYWMGISNQWQAYQNDDEQDKKLDELAKQHTTTMLARPVCWVSGVASMPQSISLKNKAAADNGFGVVGIDADRQLVWQTTMPERVHDIVVQPIIYNNKDNNADKGSEDNNDEDKNSGDNKKVNRHVVVMGRRPSEWFWVLDTATGQVQFAIQAAAKRHFYGHACYSLDGKLLYITENDTVTLNGKIGVYDAHNCYQKIAEFDSHGIGPHELIMHPDGATLVVANGGIKTEQASREELNLDTMRPSLVYLNRHNGELLEQIVPEHKQMSIRHLAMHDNGTVMIGIQFQGERHINLPLVLTHQRGDVKFTALKMPDNQWQRFHQYIASVAVDSQSNLLCVTTPIGGCAAVYDLNSYELIDSMRLPDCAGASVLPVLSYDKTHQSNNCLNNKKSGFIVSDGQGQLTTLMLAKASCVSNKQSQHIVKDSQTHKMSFDNHLQVVD